MERLDANFRGCAHTGEMFRQYRYPHTRTATDSGDWISCLWWSGNAYWKPSRLCQRQSCVDITFGAVFLENLDVDRLHRELHKAVELGT